MLKRLISVASALLLSMTCFSAAVCAEETAPTRVYRTSVEGAGTSNSYWKFIFALEAYSDGHIHIDVQCTNSSSSDCKEIGSVSFNDAYIASVGEKGYNNNISTFCGTTALSSGNSKLVSSFSDDNTIYNCVFSDWGSSYSGSTLMYFDLYAKDISTTIPFNLFGKEIEIPFGSEALPTGDAELQNMITKLKAENEELSKKNTELNTKVSELGTQNKELDTANKKYQTELENLTTQNQALATSILKFENENAALKAQLAAFDSDADGLLTTADAQMILIYYTEYLAGAVSGTTGDYAAYIKQFKGQ